MEEKKEMRTLHTWLKLATACCINCFIFIAFISPSVADCSSAFWSKSFALVSDMRSDNKHCPLNFTSYPYLPSGDSSGHNGKVILWDMISSHLCCRNALNAFAQVLAVRANQTPDGTIFIGQDSWKQCSSPFPTQQLVSIETCGFSNFYSGSSMCTNLSLSQIQGSPLYLEAVKLCSNLSSSFQRSCRNCTDAIAKVAEFLLQLLQKQTNSTETTLYPGYIKLKRSLENAFLAVFVAVMVLILILVLVKFLVLKKDERKKASETNAIKGQQYMDCEAYEGWLRSGQVVAIKEIKKGSSLNTFTREVAGISRIRHPNLVSMLGCCIEGDEQYLFLEYCHAGNLAQHLLITLSIVHRDIKLTNILLTENLEPKLLDFGLAKMLGMEESKVFTDVRRTVGKILKPFYILQYFVLPNQVEASCGPPIDVVFDELEKAWKNNEAEMKRGKEIVTSAVPQSMEMVSV
ncbi:Nodulin MtN3 family protein [Hibiscus syriacus]|uniref:Nodulin MtN3 family protein n=1 Tax=Hibiscus syriacus TaxID=106335 RepID=A0A6A2XK96_HIBSY|nr:Nodulin MtN3 family protein [Hibiscus syriacus]